MTFLVRELAWLGLVMTVEIDAGFRHMTIFKPSPARLSDLVAIPDDHYRLTEDTGRVCLEVKAVNCQMSLSIIPCTGFRYRDNLFTMWVESIQAFSLLTWSVPMKVLFKPLACAVCHCSLPMWQYLIQIKGGRKIRGDNRMWVYTLFNTYCRFSLLNVRSYLQS